MAFKQVGTLSASTTSAVYTPIVTTSAVVAPVGSLSEVKSKILEYAALLPVAKSISYTEAERRAGEFLHIRAKIADWRHVFSEEKIRLLSLQTAVYAEEMSKGTSKTVTENKLVAEASAAYTKAREDLERIENDMAYLKTYDDIFKDSHIFYRQAAKGELA